MMATAVAAMVKENGTIQAGSEVGHRHDTTTTRHLDTLPVKMRSEDPSDLESITRHGEEGSNGFYESQRQAPLTAAPPPPSLSSLSGSESSSTNAQEGPISSHVKEDKPHVAVEPGMKKVQPAGGSNAVRKLSLSLACKNQFFNW